MALSLLASKCWIYIVDQHHNPSKLNLPLPAPLALVPPWIWQPSPWEQPSRSMSWVSGGLYRQRFVYSVLWDPTVADYMGCTYRLWLCTVYMCVYIYMSYVQGHLQYIDWGLYRLGFRSLYKYRSYPKVHVKWRLGVFVTQTYIGAPSWSA